MYNVIKKYLLCYALLAGAFPVWASSSEEGIRIVPERMEVRDDSVRIALTIAATGIEIPTEQSLTLVPVLHYKDKEVLLPSVVLSGKQRYRFDRREESLYPCGNAATPAHILVDIHREGNYALNYEASIPYASWMEHAGLRLQQISRDCCTERLLSDDLLTPDINLVSPCLALQAREKPPVPVAVPEAGPAASPAEPAPVAPSVPVVPSFTTEHRAVLSLYIDYPRGGSVVDPYYGRNRGELQKVGSLINRLLSDRSVTIREIRITGYASPDGAYYDNEALAKARSLGFKSYLSKSYGLQDYPFRTAWVAEDWEGLRKLLKGKPYEKEATGIIDRYGIFEGRERILMETDGGLIYRDMLHELFPLLRRIEIIITYKKTEEV